ncbi:MAG TPA: hypothetical protein VIC35_08025 [Acidimicrobiia bacterium]|jgi:hypothetical protein
MGDALETHGGAVGVDHERGKIVITGTGRAGTTLLVALLTDLGLDTSFEPGVEINPEHRAGLERSIRPDGPRIVKIPNLAARMRTAMDAGNVTIDHVIIPVRSLEVAAASRIRLSNYGRTTDAQGGMWGTKQFWRQQHALAEQLGELVVTLAEYDLPHTLLLFPRFARDADYTYERLSFLLDGISKERFQEVLAARVRPDWIHEEPLDASERARARVLAPFTIGRSALVRLRVRAKAVLSS